MKKIKMLLISCLLLAVLLASEVIIVKSAADYEPKVNAVFAARKITQDTVITPDMLAVRQVNLRAMHRQALKGSGEAAGRRAAMDIEEGEMLLSSKLLGEDAGQFNLEDPGKRLFALEFKGDQANGWWLNAGQRVDIIFVPEQRQRDSLQIEAGIRRLKDIRIAAILDERGKRLKNTDRNTIPKYVSFEVTDRESEFLAYAKGSGRLEICLVPAAAN